MQPRSVIILVITSEGIVELSRIPLTDLQTEYCTGGGVGIGAGVECMDDDGVLDTEDVEFDIEYVELDIEDVELDFPP